MDSKLNFLKAYYHFYLLRMYGPIPIMDKAEDISQPVENFRQARVPVDSVFSYIVGLLDKAIEGLPGVIDDLQMELGRATQLIALGVKAEVLATQASPLFNGNPDYVNYKNKDGQALFPATPDNTKWQKAADACLAVITQAEERGRELYTLQPIAILPPDLTDSLKLMLTLQNAVTEDWVLNKELIWALNPTVAYQQNYIPKLTVNQDVVGATPANVGVPFATTDLFYTSNGVPLTEDKTWDYDGRFEFETGAKEDRYFIKEGYTTIRNNFDREARYYASIAFDGSIWYGGSVLSKPNTPLYVAARKGGISGILGFDRANVLGYWPKKLVHYQTTINSNGGISVQSYRMPRIRLSDLYLLYAECLNEANGPSAEVYKYIDKVRERANLKGVVESWSAYSAAPNKPLSKEGLREIIHQERRIELMFEGKAGWDLRRWKEYVTEVSKPIRGWSVTQEDINSFYVFQTYLIPVLSAKDYFWPMSESELLRNDQLVQAPFWR